LIGGVSGSTFYIILTGFATFTCFIFLFLTPPIPQDVVEVKELDVDLLLNKTASVLVSGDVAVDR
jgi:hypothetical protein